MEELYGSNRPGITHIDVQNSTEISDVTTVEILNAMKSLKNNKATGNDEIPIEYLRSVGEDTKAKIVQVIKNIYKGDEIPSEWLETVFIVLPKKQVTPKCEEHRVIALIPHAMKILNKVTYNRISTHLNEQLNPMQYGFRTKVGTIESITALKTILVNRINSKQDTYICFIDFKKAFDRVEHDILIDILNKKAIPANEIRIINKIYENQIGFMKDDSEKQYPIDIERGVRQGCILSPILFSTYVEETFKLVDKKPWHPPRRWEKNLSHQLCRRHCPLERN